MRGRRERRLYLGRSFACRVISKVVVHLVLYDFATGGCESSVWYDEGILLVGYLGRQIGYIDRSLGTC